MDNEQQQTPNPVENADELTTVEADSALTNAGKKRKLNSSMESEALVHYPSYLVLSKRTRLHGTDVLVYAGPDPLSARAG